MSYIELLSPTIAQQTAPTGMGMGNLVFLGLMFAAMYFLIIAPQRKKQKEHQKMIESLDTGDEIVTAGGIYGQITNRKEDRYVVRIADGVKIEVGKSFVQALVRKSGEEKK